MRAGKDVVLVTGATGQQGGAVARQLLARGHKVKAMTRKPDGDNAKALAELGAEVVQGDLDDAASLERAIDGAWGVFAVQNSWEAGVEGEEEQGKRTPGGERTVPSAVATPAAGQLSPRARVFLESVVGPEYSIHCFTTLGGFA